MKPEDVILPFLVTLLRQQSEEYLELRKEHRIVSRMLMATDHYIEQLQKIQKEEILGG